MADRDSECNRNLFVWSSPTRGCMTLYYSDRDSDRNGELAEEGVAQIIDNHGAEYVRVENGEMSIDIDEIDRMEKLRTLAHLVTEAVKKEDDDFVVVHEPDFEYHPGGE